MAPPGDFIFVTNRETPMSRVPVKPFLITKSEEGIFRLTVRDTRFNSQGYPIVTATLQDEEFRTATAARAFARDNFGAESGQYATK
jgi:hypothetical protein